jgi:hypothetical protein
VNGAENVHGNMLRDNANICPGAVGEDDPLQSGPLQLRT